MKLFRLVYIAAILAFGITNFPAAGIIGTYARFASLGLLAIALMGAVGSAHQQGVMNILASYGLYFGWCLTTAFWTENFWLTTLKSILVTGTMLGLFLGGSHFARKNDGTNKNPFAPMGLVLILTVLSSIPYIFTGRGFEAGNFEGATGNSNTLGAMIALSSPWLICEITNGFRSNLHKILLLVLAGLSAVMLMLSGSRASLGAATIIMSFLLASQRPTKKLLYLYAAMMLLILTFLVAPRVFNIFYSQVVLKRSEAVTASREGQMSSSWEAAKRGGLIGVGFGISVGKSRYWDFGTFSSSSREKGSSQLAVIEETGLVGFALYLVLLLTIASSIRKAFRGSTRSKKRISILTIGFVVAAIFHSGFEAWFFSIGPEAAFFWATLGLALGYLGRPVASTPIPQHANPRATVTQGV